MKKQKSPIVLFVLLGTLIIGGVFASQRAREETMSVEERMKQEQERQKATEKPRESVNKSALAELAKKTVTDDDGASPMNAGGDLMVARREMLKQQAGGVLRPTIEKPEYKPYKPVPNESAVTSQWYQQNHAKQTGG
ncbi:MAG: hypothetical protein ACOYON_00270 [Fimbriimonas sp.]